MVLEIQAPSEFFCRAAVTTYEIRLVHFGQIPIDDFPVASDHDAIGSGSAAQHERRHRIVIAAVAKFIELEERKIRLFPGCNRGGSRSDDAAAAA